MCASSASTAVASCPYLRAAKEHADNILEHGRDVYGPRHSPLFVDRLDGGTRQAIQAPWPANDPNSKPVILSNFAQQQPFYRTLSALTALTGQERYLQTAMENIRYMFRHVASPSGLLYWGGHCAYDALSDAPTGYKSSPHELKCVYPDYATMWHTDAESTRKFIEAFWNAHVCNWEVLDFSRHGRYGLELGVLWDHNYVGRPVWFSGRGLTFINAGSDLYYAATMLHLFTGDSRPLVWAKRLNHRYDETRDAGTGMTGYQFSIRNLPGANHWCDRAIHQFSGQLSGHVIREGTISKASQIWTICCRAGGIRMALAQQLGPEGSEFLSSALADLRAYGKWAYEPSTNLFHPMHTDGLRLTGMVLEEDGYYGRKGSTLLPHQADGGMLLAYATAWRLSCDRFLWDMVRNIADGIGLGQPGDWPCDQPTMKVDTACDCPSALLAMLELHRATGRAEYLAMARRIGDNILDGRFHAGFFVADRQSPVVFLADGKPLALLQLSATLSGRADALAPIPAGR